MACMLIYGVHSFIYTSRHIFLSFLASCSASCIRVSCISCFTLCIVAPGYRHIIQNICFLLFFRWAWLLRITFSIWVSSVITSMNVFRIYWIIFLILQTVFSWLNNSLPDAADNVHDWMTVFPIQGYTFIAQEGFEADLQWRDKRALYDELLKFQNLSMMAFLPFWIGGSRFGNFVEDTCSSFQIRNFFFIVILAVLSKFIWDLLWLLM